METDTLHYTMHIMEKIEQKLKLAKCRQENRLPFPPDDLINPPEKDDPPPLGQFWIYTCPKCGGKMSTYENWCGTTPAPITCSKCGYTIQGKMNVEFYTSIS